MKKILFIAPDFYDYTKLIVDTLKIKDFQVDFFDSRIKSSQFKKWLIKYIKGYKTRAYDQYTKHIIEETSEKKYDVVFMIATVNFNATQISKILEAHKDSKKIFYMWDSVSNYVTIVNQFNLFDKSYSFDPKDCEVYGLSYQPTFYSRNLLSQRRKNSDFNHDLIFVGSFLPSRYEMLKKVAKILDNSNLKYSFFIYIRTHFTYLFYKILNRNLKMKKKDFSFDVLPENQKNELLYGTKAIIDIPFNEQAGLTMRVIEALVLEKKIITTNKYISEFPIYDKQNILIIDKETNVDKEFFVTPFKPLSNDLINEFSIENWINTIIISNL